MTNGLKSIQGVNLLDLLQPGIIKIICKNTNRAFFWGGANVLEEIGNFRKNLINGTLDNPLLLQDYQTYGLESFSIIIVIASPELENKQQREAMLISIKNDWQGQLY